jgi:hypothetical protein
MNKTLISAVCASIGLLAASGAQAYTTYSGIDNNGNPGVALSLIPNSSAAESSFKSQLTGVGTETFESYAAGTSTPLAIAFPGAGTATLNGGGSVESVTSGFTNGFGRYSVPSLTSTKYWEVVAGAAGNFDVNFSSTIAAFGFYGIDIGDFAGTLTIDLFDSANALVGSLVVPTAAQNVADGSVLYFGFIAANAGEQFTKVSFRTTTGTGDVFAFDNFTIGTQEQVCRENCAVPEPGSLALFSLGLLGLGLARRRKTA